MPYKNPEKLKAYQAKWRQANRIYSEEWRKTHPNYQEEWRKVNPDYSKVRNSNRRTIEKITTDDIDQLLKEQNYRCANQFCRISFNETTYTIDHWTPISRGGTNDLYNVHLLCPLCNKLKGTRTMEEYYMTILIMMFAIKHNLYRLS